MRAVCRSSDIPVGEGPGLSGVLASTLPVMGKLSNEDGCNAVAFGGTPVEALQRARRVPHDDWPAPLPSAAPFSSSTVLNCSVTPLLSFPILWLRVASFHPSDSLHVADLLA